MFKHANLGISSRKDKALSRKDCGVGAAIEEKKKRHKCLFKKIEDIYKNNSKVREELAEKDKTFAYSSDQ